MSFRLISPLLIRNLAIIDKIVRIPRRHVETVKENEPDKPIQYTTSKAGTWKAVHSSSGPEYFKTPKSQPFAVMISLTALMVYFCMLREENDLDDWLRELEREVPMKIEMAELRGRIEHGKRTHTNTRVYEKKMEELSKSLLASKTN